MQTDHLVSAQLTPHRFISDTEESLCKPVLKSYPHYWENTYPTFLLSDTFVQEQRQKFESKTNAIDRERSWIKPKNTVLKRKHPNMTGSYMGALAPRGTCRVL